MKTTIIGMAIITLIMVLLALLPDFNLFKIHIHYWIAGFNVLLVFGWIFYCFRKKMWRH